MKKLRCFFKLCNVSNFCWVDAHVDCCPSTLLKGVFLVKQSDDRFVCLPVKDEEASDVDVLIIPGSAITHFKIIEVDP